MKKQKMYEDKAVHEAYRVHELNTGQMRRSVYYFQCTDSTNLRAKSLAKEGAVHGSVVVAEEQTAGRGRRGRIWSSPKGKSLYFSLLLKPDFMPDKASMLTLVMALAVAEGVERSLHTMEEAGKKMGACKQEPEENIVGIKWPNDLVVRGRKICGILTEMTLEQTAIENVVIGVGVNVERQDFSSELVDKATSLEAECGKKPDKGLLLAEILRAFEEHYERFIQTLDLTALQEKYNARLVNCGRGVCVLDPKGELQGVARGINSAGELLVEKKDGTIEAVYAGEVSVRGIYGYV